MVKYGRSPVQEGLKMLRSLYRWWLVSWPVSLIHAASRRLHEALFREFDPFEEFSDAAARSKPD